MKYRIFILCLPLFVVISSCKTEIDEPVPSSGSANFTSYVALGSSFMAGVTNGALYTEGQQNSLPSMLAKSFSGAGGGTFRQPDVNSAIGTNLQGKSRLKLFYEPLCNGTSGFSIDYAEANGDQSIFSNNISALGPFNNLGIPGAKSFNFNDQYYSNISLGNPFYARFAKIPGTSTLLSDAVALSPTFFTLSIGQEDIYDYARSGGDELMGDSITSLSYFSFNIDNIINTLVATGAKGAVTNIPDPSDIPYFTYIPYDGLILTASESQQLNIFFASSPDINFTEGRNPFLVHDLSVSGGIRMMKSTEFVLLSANQDSICNGYGSYSFARNSSWGFEDRHVLDEGELSLIRSSIFNYNSKLSAVAAANNLAFVDMFSLFRQLNSGIVVNGVMFNNDLITGRTYSLDGFRLTPQGYAILANAFIGSINLKYGSTLKEVDPNSYPGIQFP